MSTVKYFEGKTGAPIQNQTLVLDRIKTFAQTCKENGKKSVVFIGENHEDPTAHEHQLDILKVLSDFKPSLSLEFYERDVQPILNEYMTDCIDYDTFLQDSRPPNNHQDYRPLIDFCKEKNLPVLAANCARRYTRIVGRNGRAKLEEMAGCDPEYYRMALPPLPYQEASEKYCNKFKEIMGIVASDKEESRILRMLDSQTLWDASMAHTIAKSWEKCDLTVQVCGYFHCQHFLGIGEHLPKYYDSNKYESMTIVVFPEDPQELNFDPEEHTNIADVLVMSDISRMM